MSVFRLEVINFVPDLLRGGGSLYYDCMDWSHYTGPLPCQVGLSPVVGSCCLSTLQSPQQLADGRSDISSSWQMLTEAKLTTWKPKNVMTRVFFFL